MILQPGEKALQIHGLTLRHCMENYVAGVLGQFTGTRNMEPGMPPIMRLILWLLEGFTHKGNYNEINRCSGPIGSPTDLFNG